MEKGAETENKYPFEISHDEDFDWSDLTIDIELDKPAVEEERKKLEGILANWADKGIKEGYGEGVMHDWSEEENEWDMEGKRLRFWVDMGSSEETALDNLFSRLSDFSGVKRISFGSRHYD